MPIFITQGRYTREAIKGMITKPEDRAEAVSRLFAKGGGRLLNYYVTFGEYDFLLIAEAPSETQMAAILMAAGSSGGVTGLLLRSTNSVLPGGTRFIEFTLAHQVVSAMNDASADNLSFVLTPPALFITTHGTATNGWQVTFFGSSNLIYVLERSTNLETWTDATLPTPGSGSNTTLTDTNAPAGRAYYRVGRREP